MKSAEIRRAFLDYFKRQGASGSGQQLVSALGRSYLVVHECQDEPVQGRVPG